MNTDSITLLDGTVLVVLLIGIARGLFIGMIRETFSIAAFGSACILLRFGNEIAANWLMQLTNGGVGTAAPWITGAVIMVGTVGLISFLGRLLKRGVEAVGLGIADRLGGGALGLVEGALLSTLIVIGTSVILGRDNDTIKNSQSVEAVDFMREYVMKNSDDLPDVAAPFRRGIDELKK